MQERKKDNMQFWSSFYTGLSLLHMVQQRNPPNVKCDAAAAARWALPSLPDPVK